MRSMIAILNTPSLGPGQLLTLVGYSSVFPKIHCSQAIYIIVAISLVTIVLPPIGIRFSVFSVWRQSKILEGGRFIFLQQKMCLKTSKMNWFNIFEIIKVLWWLQIKHNKMTFLFYGSKIAVNEPQQVYLAITKRINILITHRSYMDWKPNIRNTLTPYCCSNSYHVTD